jgi:hypothetical protein
MKFFISIIVFIVATEQRRSGAYPRAPVFVLGALANRQEPDRKPERE